MISKIKTKIISLPEYEKSFIQNKQGWLGSDCAYSLPLTKNRVLWLFGDTFINNKGTDLKTRQNSDFINNSIAIQTSELVDTNNPLTFFWNNKKDQTQSFFINSAFPGFLWPLSAIIVSNKLYVFTVRVVQSDSTKAFGFEQTGNEIICIENPNDNPDNWKMDIFKLPWQQHQISFVSYLLKSDDYLYIYGYRRDGKNLFKSLKLYIARINLKHTGNLFDISRWEYLEGVTGKWSEDIAGIKPVFSNSNTEFSVSYLSKFNKYVFIGNSYEPPNAISIRFSDTPYGPFTKPEIIYYCPEAKWNPDYFCYAAKAHPELSDGENDLVITYMTNSKKLQECINDMRIYYPRFLRILFE